MVGQHADRLEEWATRLTGIATQDGSLLLLNVFLSASGGPWVWFPATDVGLPEPGPRLFVISSVLPEPMIRNARAADLDVAPGSRALAFNADPAVLTRFLEIGTRFDVRDDG